MGMDFGNAEVLERVPTDRPNCGCHDASSPIRLCQAVADFGLVRPSDHKAIESNAADHLVLLPNCPIDRLAVLLCCFFYDAEPLVGVGKCVWVRNP